MRWSYRGKNATLSSATTAKFYSQTSIQVTIAVMINSVTMICAESVETGLDLTKRVLCTRIIQKPVALKQIDPLARQQILPSPTMM